MKTGLIPAAVDNRLKLYRSEAAQWKVDHEQAPEYPDFELLLQGGLAVYEAINHIDESWRALVLAGEEEYLQEKEDCITNLYRLWLEPWKDLLSDLKDIEATGYKVKYAEEFYRACVEVCGILTPDEKFFSGDELVELRDNAIDSLRRGECEPVEA